MAPIKFVLVITDRPCDFGETEACPEPAEFVTTSNEWVVPMFACKYCRAQFAY